MKARRLIPLGIVAVAAIVMRSGRSHLRRAGRAMRLLRQSVHPRRARQRRRSLQRSLVQPVRARGPQAGSEELGVKGRPVESRQTSDYVPNLASLARQKYDLSISVGFLLAGATNDVVERFKNSKFAIIDYSVKAAVQEATRTSRA